MAIHLGKISRFLLARGRRQILRRPFAVLTSMEEGEYNHSVTEGQAKVLFKSEQEAFYNPVQEFNRDMSIAVIQLYLKKIRQEAKDREEAQRKKDEAAAGPRARQSEQKKKEPEKIVLLEALAATGLRFDFMHVVYIQDLIPKPFYLLVRSIRYAKEIDGLDEIICNDLSRHAVEAIKRNVKANQVEHIVTPSHNGEHTKRAKKERI